MNANEVAQALRGVQAGQRVEVEAPDGRIYPILSIEDALVRTDDGYDVFILIRCER